MEQQIIQNRKIGKYMERWVYFRGKMESMKGGLWLHKRGEIEKIKGGNSYTLHKRGEMDNFKK